MDERGNRHVSLNIVTVIVVTIGIVLYALMYFVVYGLMEKVSVDRLNEAAKYAAQKASLTFSNNQETLENIADSISKHEKIDDEALIKSVNTFLPKKGTARISAIFPDNRIVTVQGTIEKSDLTFESMKADIERGESFSRRDTSRLNPEEVIIRQYMPVYKDGKMELILYAIYDCNKMDDFTDLDIYGDRSNVQLLDTRDGKVIADDYFESVNATDHVTIDGAKLKGGGRLKLSKMLKGGSGEYLFLNNLAGNQYMFLSYAPTIYKEFIVAIYVPEKAAYAETRQYRSLLYLLGLGEVILLSMFLAWVKNRKRVESEHLLEDRKRYLELTKLKQGRSFEAAKDEIEAIFGALAEGYDTLIHIQFDTCKIITYRAGRAFAIPEETWATVGDYHAVMREYAKIKAVPEDREMLIEQTSFKNVWEDLSRGLPHVVKFRAGDEDKPEYIKIKFVHILEHGTDHCAVVGFRYIGE